jgi:hypothetical protein
VRTTWHPMLSSSTGGAQFHSLRKIPPMFEQSAEDWSSRGRVIQKMGKECTLCNLGIERITSRWDRHHQIVCRQGKNISFPFGHSDRRRSCESPA